MTIEDLYPCPCCGNKTISELGDYEICPVCGWEDDPVQSEDPDFSGGANSNNLNDAKKKYFKK
ncbi:TPA: CPCC family cysteine-rich protein [Proteus mirabilis]|uniref:CPCC family cysteine-rich protein n=1 Tax=Morganellaceae TaxID=1903414 RepID=UPI00269285EA